VTIKKKLKHHFIPNTPLTWIHKALLLQGNVNAAKLALYIWYVKGLKQTKTDLVISSSTASDIFGVNKRSFTRALKELVDLGMITTSIRERGKSPRVAVIWEDSERE
jgi:DNA-binding transcriptional ArsR family regulator